MRLALMRCTSFISWNIPQHTSTDSTCFELCSSIQRLSTVAMLLVSSTNDIIAMYRQPQTLPTVFTRLVTIQKLLEQLLMDTDHVMTSREHFGQTVQHDRVCRTGYLFTLWFLQHLKQDTSWMCKSHISQLHTTQNQLLLLEIPSNCTTKKWRSLNVWAVVRHLSTRTRCLAALVTWLAILCFVDKGKLFIAIR